MPNERRHAGWPDQLMNARLDWLSGAALPKPPKRLSILLLSGIPANDGSLSGVHVMARADGIRLSAPQHLSGLAGFAHERFTEPSEPVAFSVPGEARPGLHIDAQAWALCDGDTGEVLYSHAHPLALNVGEVTVLPASTFRVFAEHPGQS